MKMPPRSRTFDMLPADGWYVAEVAYNAQNPVHTAVLRVTNNSRRGVIASTSVEDPADDVSRLHYLRIVRRIDMGSQP